MSLSHFGLAGANSVNEYLGRDMIIIDKIYTCTNYIKSAWQAMKPYTQIE